ncbi:MAG: hypothetical protein HFF39_04615 [Lawsonibacter sp.]|nr:hypothetical protein [Lawsonibacter sp.]
MGIFLGVLGIFLVAAGALALAGMIAGGWGLVIGAALLAAALARAGLSAWWELKERLERVEQKLDALLEQRNRSDAE